MARREENHALWVLTMIPQWCDCLGWPMQNVWDIGNYRVIECIPCRATIRTTGNWRLGFAVNRLHMRTYVQISDEQTDEEIRMRKRIHEARRDRDAFLTTQYARPRAPKGRP